MVDSDAETIRVVLAGDVDRYAELVDRYQDRAIRLAFSFVGNYEDARDVAQDAFVSAYRSLGRFRGAARFSTWLYRIVVNRCKDVHRFRARHPVIPVGVGGAGEDAEGGESLFVDAPDPRPGPSDQAVNRELSHRLTAAIRELPMNQRAAFLLHHVHGLSVEEAARIMGCRSGTVKSHLFRATSSLRERLTPWLTQEPT
jgi:RNA polymerase sigma-70 factor (ECF subfamily)